jgi:hypothetical protein
MVIGPSAIGISRRAHRLRASKPHHRRDRRGHSHRYRQWHRVDGRDVVTVAPIEDNEIVSAPRRRRLPPFSSLQNVVPTTPEAPASDLGPMSDAVVERNEVKNTHRSRRSARNKGEPAALNDTTFGATTRPAT